LDSRWAIDLKAFHPTAAHSTDTGKVKFDIKLKEGLLYAARRTDPINLKTFLLRPTAVDPEDFKRIGAIIGVNVYLDANTSLKLDWNDGGVPRQWLLPKGGIDGGPFRVSIDNGPKHSGVHEDFDIHYNAITVGALGVPGGQRFRFLFRAGLLKTNVDAPCMSSMLDGEGRG
jgi:hypothetical protein